MQGIGLANDLNEGSEGDSFSARVARQALLPVLSLDGAGRPPGLAQRSAAALLTDLLDWYPLVLS